MYVLPRDRGAKNDAGAIFRWPSFSPIWVLGKDPGRTGRRERLTGRGPPLSFRANSTAARPEMAGGEAFSQAPGHIPDSEGLIMKIRNSLKSLRGRHRDNRLVRRKGRVYIINKTNPRYKARQG